MRKKKRKQNNRREKEEPPNEQGWQQQQQQNRIQSSPNPKIGNLLPFNDTLPQHQSDPIPLSDALTHSRASFIAWGTRVLPEATRVPKMWGGKQGGRSWASWGAWRGRGVRACMRVVVGRRPTDCTGTIRSSRISASQLASLTHLPFSSPLLLFLPLLPSLSSLVLSVPLSFPPSPSLFFSFSISFFYFFLLLFFFVFPFLPTFFFFLDLSYSHSSSLLFPSFSVLLCFPPRSPFYFFHPSYPNFLPL